jgi:ribonuclease HIII|tara:strand:- start:14 stop:388 length:375 start_codon:yes stop_codon:yes gene_type:complete
MRYLWILLLSIPLFGQQTLTDEQVLSIANQIKELQYSDSTKSVQIKIYEGLVKEYEEQMNVDSLIIVAKNKQIESLRAQNKANEKMVKLAKPSWYENKWLYFGYGVAAVTIPTYFGIKIVDIAN